MEMVKVIFTSIKEMEHVVSGVLPSGVWLWNTLTSGDLDNRAFYMPKHFYLEFESDIESYDHIVIKA